MAWAFFNLGTEPKPLDIVWCRFPYAEAPSLPAPDPHPCVVKRSFVDQDGNPWLHAVYGTSQDVGDGFGTYKITGPYVGYHGLKKDPTTICLWRIAEIPYSKEFFPLIAGGVLPTAYPMHADLKHSFTTEAAFYEHQKQPQINEEVRKASGEAAE